ncbi:protein of unknown function DUF1684 [Candidatus Koribacter versatilis Ellin345]|uniref:DUF1684 domain-containing protein n=1 Tax=Koribacter versatilis (strain Ellin345) TaxID=204669 RepID=Q1IQ66_KORVE|nr:DUF1684 domain-containing protein [Candidatus Koribacter versatilis]ABF40984.1 protein of unknown function DUF1684 [Candidatus Koribacter versatilis Ellin345]
MRLLTFALICTLFVPAVAQTPKASAPNAWRHDLLQWRAKRAQKLSAPDGWLAVVGLDWLKPGDNKLGSDGTNDIKLPASSPAQLGVTRLDNNSLLLQPPSAGFAQDLTVNGTPPVTAVPLFADTDPQPSKLTVGTLFITIIHRGDRYGVRIKDSAARARVDFKGLHWYAPDPAYRVHAKYIPYDSPQTRTIPSVIGIDQTMAAPGLVEFTLNGQTLKLEPLLEKPDAKELFFVLRDTTSQTETYGAARSLYSELPSNSLSKPGEVWLDFNRLENPPCAFTQYATCPLPLPINKLQVPIRAGEKRYHD